MMIEDNYGSGLFSHWLEDLKNWEPMHTNSDWEVHFETPKVVWDYNERRDKNKENVKRFLDHLYKKYNK